MYISLFAKSFLFCFSYFCAPCLVLSSVQQKREQCYCSFSPNSSTALVPSFLFPIVVFSHPLLSLSPLVCLPLFVLASYYYICHMLLILLIETRRSDPPRPTLSVCAYILCIRVCVCVSVYIRRQNPFSTLSAILYRDLDTRRVGYWGGGSVGGTAGGCGSGR